MQKWEYACMVFELGSDPGDSDTELLTKCLDSVGAEGWNIAGQSTLRDGSILFTLKRPLPLWDTDGNPIK